PPPSSSLGVLRSISFCFSTFFFLCIYLGAMKSLLLRSIAADGDVMFYHYHWFVFAEHPFQVSFSVLANSLLP
uniref:Uncharacterized protein n=1 Tax=Oryza brachyantha TaxID=4533 RepID=J3MA63_ORYBR